MLSLNGMRPFGGKLNTKTVRAWPKMDNIESFRVQDVTYGIITIAQPEMGERAQAYRGRQQGRWVLKGGDYDVPHCLGIDYMICLYRICSL